MLIVAYTDSVPVPWLQELTSQALRSAIKRCGRGGTALAAQETSEGAALTAARALSTAKLLTSVTALSRQLEIQLMHPRMTLLAAGALGLNFLERTSAMDDPMQEPPPPEEVAAKKAKEEKKKAKVGRLTPG